MGETNFIIYFSSHVYLLSPPKLAILSNIWGFPIAGYACYKATQEIPIGPENGSTSICYDVWLYDMLCLPKTDQHPCKTQNQSATN